MTAWKVTQHVGTYESQAESAHPMPGVHSRLTDSAQCCARNNGMASVQIQCAATLQICVDNRGA
jgi:hypothetical protein